MSGAAGGHGTPAPRDGCSAPALRAFLVCASLGPRCTSIRAFRRPGRGLKSRFDTEPPATTFLLKIRPASAAASPSRSSTAPPYSRARRGHLWLTTARSIGCGSYSDRAKYRPLGHKSFSEVKFLLFGLQY